MRSELQLTKAKPKTVSLSSAHSSLSRRGFFAALAALPVFARLFPKPRTTGGLFDPHANVYRQYEAAREKIALAFAHKEGGFLFYTLGDGS